MRRAQIEIMGLLIIVIIISFMLLFVISTMLSPKKQTLPQYNNRAIGGMFIGAMLKTSSNCTEDTDIEDLILDCVKNPETNGSIGCDNGEQSCEFMAEVLDELLNNSYDQIQQNYVFTIKSPDNEIIYERRCNKANECTSDVPVKCLSAQQQLPIYEWGVRRGDILIIMGLDCG